MASSLSCEKLGEPSFAPRRFMAALCHYSAMRNSPCKHEPRSEDNPNALQCNHFLFLKIVVQCKNRTRQKHFRRKFRPYCLLKSWQPSWFEISRWNDIRLSTLRGVAIWVVWVLSPQKTYGLGVFCCCGWGGGVVGVFSLVGVGGGWVGAGG